MFNYGVGRGGVLHAVAYTCASINLAYGLQYCAALPRHFVPRLVGIFSVAAIAVVQQLRRNMMPFKANASRCPLTHTSQDIQQFQYTRLLT